MKRKKKVIPNEQPFQNIMISKEKEKIRYQQSLWKRIFIFDAVSSYPSLDIKILMMQRNLHKPFAIGCIGSMA